MPLSRHSLGTNPENELVRNLSGITQPQLFQLVEPLWTDPGLKSGISVYELISTSQKRKKERKKADRPKQVWPSTLTHQLTHQLRYQPRNSDSFGCYC